MTDKKQLPDHNQCGKNDADGRVVDVYANRPGGEEPATGPMDTVTSSGHRVGAIEQHADPKPSSRIGQKVLGEVDGKKR